MSPTVLVTVRSLGSALRIFSYSAMAFCILPCWTYFSAALRTFCLLKPKPNAIRVRTPDPGVKQEPERYVAKFLFRRWPIGQGQLYGWKGGIAWLLRITKRECTKGLLRESG